MSKFSGLIKAAQEEKQTPAQPKTSQPKTSQSKTTAGTEKAVTAKPTAKTAKTGGSRKARAGETGAEKGSAKTASPKEPSSTVVETTGKGTKRRKIGRSADPDYSKSTMYIHHQVHQEVKRALIGTNRDYSELVEELLRRWLKESQ